MDSDCTFGILDLRILITPLVSYIYGFWLPHWYLRFTDSDYPFGILDLRILIAPWYLRFTDSDCAFGILNLRILIAPLES
jgi:hypothetical protein